MLVDVHWIKTSPNCLRKHSQTAFRTKVSERLEAHARVIFQGNIPRNQGQVRETCISTANGQTIFPVTHLVVDVLLSPFWGDVRRQMIGELHVCSLSSASSWSYKELRWLSAFANEPSIDWYESQLNSVCFVSSALPHYTHWTLGKTFNWFVGSRMTCLQSDTAPFACAHLEWGPMLCQHFHYQLNLKSLAGCFELAWIDLTSPRADYRPAVDCQFKRYLIDKSPYGS